MFATISEILSRVEVTENGVYFVFEPGRLVYNTLELCNFVHRCVAIDTSPSLLISKSTSMESKTL